MRELAPDIIQEMKIRFESDYSKAEKLLSEYVIANDYLDSDKVIRCIIFLADKGIESFKTYLEAAKGDPRDVMWWAEYDTHDSSKKSNRIRNFEKTFQENDI